MQISNNSTVLDFFQSLLHTAPPDSHTQLAMFLGWGTCKIENKLVFDNKRDDIVHFINAALIDMRIWKDAMSKNELLSPVNPGSRPKTIEEVLPQDTDYNCIVDTS